MWENDPHLDSLPVLETELAACQVDSHNPNDKSRLRTRNLWLPYSHVPVFTGPGGFHVSWWEGTLFHGNPGLTNPTDDQGCHNPGFALDGLLPPKLLCNAPEDLWRGWFFQVPPATGATVAGTLMFFLTSPLDVFLFFLQLKAPGSLPRPRVRRGSTVGLGSEGSGSGGSDLGCMGLPRSACKCASRC